MNTRRFAAVALSATLTIGTPAHAADNDAFTEQAMWIAEQTNCMKSPDRLWSGRTPERSEVAATATTGAVYYASGLMDPDTYGGHRQVIINGTKCFVSDSDVALLSGNLDTSTFDSLLLLPEEQYSGLLLADAASSLFGGKPRVYSMPSLNAPVLADLEVGDFLVGADWEVFGAASMTGRASYIPVSFGGSLAWVPSSVVARVPVYSTADLTSALTPALELAVHSAPSTSADVVGSLAEGATVAAQTTAWAGWLPVANDGTVGWVQQSALVATPTETASPAADTAEAPSWFDEKKEEFEDYRDEKADKKPVAADPNEPGLIDKARDWFAGENPVAEAAAKVSLFMAGGVALLALLLAGLAHMGTRSVRRGRSSLTGRVVTLAAPGVTTLLMLGAPVAALVAGVAAASLAPTTYFTAQVAGGSLLVGLALAYVAAHRVAAMRGASADAVLIGAKVDSTLLFSITAGVAVAAHFVLAVGLPVAAVVGLVAAGLVAGLRVPVGLPDTATDEPAYGDPSTSRPFGATP